MSDLTRVQTPRSRVTLVLAIALVVAASTPMAGRGQDTELIAPSTTVPLVPGQKLMVSDFDRMMRPYTIQRLTERAYWVEVMGYQSTVLVGDRGVLVIDSPRDGRGAAIIQAIRTELTELPITTLVYSLADCVAKEHVT